MSVLFHVTALKSREEVVEVFRAVGIEKTSFFEHDEAHLCQRSGVEQKQTAFAGKEILS